MCKKLAKNNSKIVLTIHPNIDNLTLADTTKHTSNQTCAKLQTRASLSLFRLDMPTKSHKKKEEETQRKFLWQDTCCLMEIKDLLPI